MELILLILFFGFLSRLFGDRKPKRRSSCPRHPWYSTHQNDYQNYHE